MKQSCAPSRIDRVNRLAQDALAAFNFHVALRDGHQIDEWPATIGGWSPVEASWCWQPWVMPKGFDRDQIPCWWQHGTLRWWDRDTRFHVWTPPQVIVRFVADWDRGRFPALLLAA
jgi:hypothetical protein